jgi:hypothetical protein
MRVILDILYCDKRNNLVVQSNALSLLLRRQVAMIKTVIGWAVPECS